MKEKIKYSFLIPAYNRVKDTEIAIKSVLKQKNKNFEIIVLDDKSTEDFTSLIKKYKNEVKFLKHKINGGLSISRMDLIKEAKGEFFILLDNDDYIDESFLEIVDPYLNKEIDILSFTNDEVKNGKVVKTFNKTPFELDNGLNIMINWILNGISFDSACFYVYNRKFFIDNKFTYTPNKTHEDFGLTPIILSKAKNMISIDKPLYHVVLSDVSIVREKDIKKIKSNIYDKLYHYDNLMDYFRKLEIDINQKKIIYSFLSNTILSNINKLSGLYNKEFIKELKKREVHKYLLNDTFKRRIKKFLVGINYKFVYLFER